MKTKWALNYKKLFFRISVVIILLLIVGLYFANRFVKSKGFEGLGDFWTTYSFNKDLAAKIEPEDLKIIITEDDYDFLVERRQKSLDRGIQINTGNKYIPCQLLTNGDTINGELRLKGHMTDHLEGEKWSFRVKTEDEYKEMYRFSLQNPSTRSYANEWVYHQLLKNEDIMALKYDFIHLQLNEKDLGIYAVEEHFGQHIPRDNNRPKGAILRWNPELFWEWRIREYDQNYLDLQDGEYQNSYVEPYDKGVVRKDPELIDTYLKGAYLLETFRRGEATTSEVFDIVKMARFHAIIDLVGGHHSLDWSDVKLFYNSETNKIEPVGYESFSIRETTALSGQQTADDFSDPSFDYHVQLFSDPVFYETYIKELTRIAQNEYLASFESHIRPKLNEKIGILAHEFAYIKFSFDPYYKNIEKIQQLIELKKPVHAFLEEKSDSSVIISVCPVSDFPIEVVGLRLKSGEVVAPDSLIVVPAKIRNTYPRYFDVQFNTSLEKFKDLLLVVKIPGGPEFEIEILDFPSYRKKEIKPPNFSSDSVLSKLNDSTFVFPFKYNLVKDQIRIDKHQKLVVYAGQTIEFANTGKLFSEGKLELHGNEEEEIEIICNSQDSSCIDLKNSSLVARHTNFSGNTLSIFRSEGSEIIFNTCYLFDVKGVLIDGELSVVKLNNCISGNVHVLSDLSHSKIHVSNSSIRNGKTIVAGIGSIIRIRNSNLSGYNEVFKADQLTCIKIWNSELEDNETIASLNNGSTFNTYGGEILRTNVGFNIDLSSFSDQPSSYNLYRTSSSITKLEERKS